MMPRSGGGTPASTTGRKSISAVEAIRNDCASQSDLWTHVPGMSAWKNKLRLIQTYKQKQPLIQTSVRKWLKLVTVLATRKISVGPASNPLQATLSDHNAIKAGIKDQRISKKKKN